MNGAPGRALKVIQSSTISRLVSTGENALRYGTTLGISPAIDGEHAEAALRGLWAAILSRDGLSLVTGGSRAARSDFAARFLEQVVRRGMKVILAGKPTGDLLALTARALGRDDPAAPMPAIAAALAACAAEQRGVVLLVNRAEELDDRWLRGLAGLLELGDGGGKLVQIVLVGGPELSYLLAEPVRPKLPCRFMHKIRLAGTEPAEAGAVTPGAVLAGTPARARLISPGVWASLGVAVVVSLAIAHLDKPGRQTASGLRELSRHRLSVAAAPPLPATIEPATPSADVVSIQPSPPPQPPFLPAPPPSLSAPMAAPLPSGTAPDASPGTASASSSSPATARPDASPPAADATRATPAPPPAEDAIKRQFAAMPTPLPLLPPGATEPGDHPRATLRPSVPQQPDREAAAALAPGLLPAPLAAPEGGGASRMPDSTVPMMAGMDLGRGFGPRGRAAGPGLLLVAQTGDTMSRLYSRIYHGLTPPPYSVVAAGNPTSVRPGTVLVFPAPPGGWASGPSNIDRTRTGLVDKVVAK